MKNNLIALILLLTVALTVIAFSHFRRDKGPHGGRIQVTGNYAVEMYENYPFLNACLLNRKLKPIGNKNISCYAEFCYCDMTEKRDTFEPFGDEGFRMKLPAKEFCSCRFFFNMRGKIISAEFENEILITDKE